MLSGLEVGRTGSGLCPVADFDSGGVETWCPAAGIS